MHKNNMVEFTEAAWELCKDYRDTLYYTGLGVGEVCNLNFDWNIPAPLLLSLASFRELARASSWLLHKPSITLDGAIDSSRKWLCVNSACSALFSTYMLDDAIAAVGNHSPGSFSIYPVINSVAFFGNLSCAGGVKNVIKTYREIMWDHPRKNKPPGGNNPIVRKVKEFSEWVGSHVRPPVPAPAGASLTMKESSLRHRFVSLIP